MASIGVNIYSFHIHDKDGKQLNLNEVVDGKSIIDLFVEFINSKKENYEDNSSKEQIYKFVDYEIVQQKDRAGLRYLKYLYGRVKTGNYGIETEIVDKNTGDISHKQTRDEAGVKPFDFVIALPEDPCDKTIIVMQTVSRYGIKSLMATELNSFIRETYELGYVFFGTIYPKEFVQKYIREGILGKMRFIRDGIPEDMAEMYGINRGNRKSKKETIITSPFGFKSEIIDKIKDCVRGNLVYSDIVELGDNEEYDDIKLEFKLAGKTKTISLKNLEKTVISEDITSRVDTLGGNPLKESIQTIMVDYVTDYLIEMDLVARLDNIESEVISSIKVKDDVNERINE